MELDKKIKPNLYLRKKKTKYICNALIDVVKKRVVKLQPPSLQETRKLQDLIDTNLITKILSVCSNLYGLRVGKVGFLHLPWLSKMELNSDLAYGFLAPWADEVDQNISERKKKNFFGGAPTPQAMAQLDHSQDPCAFRYHKGPGGDVQPYHERIWFGAS
jgi:hypothetical protein